MNEITNDITNLIEDCQSLILSTLSVKGNLQHQAIETSYAPFVYLNKRFYILVSELASHTQSLLTHNRCGLMIIEDESKAKNIYARKRLSLQCGVKRISRTQDICSDALNALEQRHGNTVNLLRQLPDFLLFQLYPTHGTFVKGFGNAFTLVDGQLDQPQAITQEKLASAASSD